MVQFRMHDNFLLYHALILLVSVVTLQAYLYNLEAPKLKAECVEGARGDRPSAGAAGCTVHNPECAVRLGYTVS